MGKLTVVALLFSVFFIALLPVSRADDSLKNKSDFEGVFEIINSEVNYSQEQNCNFITCIGEIKNLTNEIWEDFVLEVKYFDSKGKLIDTETDHLYDNVLQPKDTMTFRVRVQADRDASEYISHALRITAAQNRTNYEDCYNTKEESSPWIDVIISWTPMLILIAVWVFFMRSFTRKKSPQAKTVESLENQAKLMEKQNQLFERLVRAVEDNSIKKE